MNKNIVRLFATASLAFASVSAFSETYAVCVGVNEYAKTKDAKGTEVDHNLKGAVNDANSMHDVLVKTYGAKPENVHMLLDKDANGDKIITEIKWLLTTAKEGDQIIFSYSGHGARLEDKTQADGYESVIVLSDLKLVPGKLFGEIAKMEAANGVNASFVFDSCFSGGMSRDTEYRLKSLGVISKKSMEGAAFKKITLPKPEHVKFRTKQVIAKKGSYAFAYAGQRDQPTIDLSLGDKAHGLFTILFLAVLEDNPKRPVKELFEAVNATLTEINKKLKEKKPDFAGFDQKPDFEASNGDRAALPIVIAK